jgi:hypothetical protein
MEKLVGEKRWVKDSYVSDQVESATRELRCELRCVDYVRTAAEAIVFVVVL